MLNNRYKEKIENHKFEYTRKLLKEKLRLLFYDIATLYFESSEEDELRITSHSKDGKHQHPQIMIGLLVGQNGYLLGYEIFEGNMSESKTLIPVLERFVKQYKIHKPTMVADAALLSQKNIDHVRESRYEFILGGRIKNETDQIKKKIQSLQVLENQPKGINHSNGRLIITFSSKRQKKNFRNRERGIERLEKKIKSGKLTNENINNRGYNKYLQIKVDVSVCINYEKFEKDNLRDGLRGYLTNAEISIQEIISAYNDLWMVEKAFRISKTNLSIRPIYHRLKNRIESHIFICLTAYAVYKEFERLLRENRIDISIDMAIEEIKDIHQITYLLPRSEQPKSKLLKLNSLQNQIVNILWSLGHASHKTGKMCGQPRKSAQCGSNCRSLLT